MLVSIPFTVVVVKNGGNTSWADAAQPSVQVQPDRPADYEQHEFCRIDPAS